MKKTFKHFTILLQVVCLVILNSCSEEFLERDSESQFTKDQFYQTPEQISVATNSLYISSWKDWASNRFWVFSELAGGNGITTDSRNRDFGTFVFDSSHEQFETSWASLYGVVAQSNSVIKAITTQAGPDVSKAQIDNAIGEARAMRATAYFFLVRLYGDIPIYEDTEAAALNTDIKRNIVSDVYRFIKEDLEFAANNITHTKAGQPGRITANAAKALLAKVNLHTEDYDEAYNLTLEVVGSGAYDLMENYADLFLTENDNNKESMIALQWTGTGDFNEGNGLQSMFAYSQITGFSDGWSAIGPSIDLIESYEKDDSDVVIDQRFDPTLMTPGTVYSDLNQGYVVSNDPSTFTQRALAGIKKYVVGRPEFNGGGAQQSYANNTYILRYADVLLMHAEAILRGGGGTVSDAAAVLNTVRDRAGLDPIASPTLEDVFEERRHEFAFEGERWYDILRMDNRLQYLANIERGYYNNNDRNDFVSVKTTVTEDQLVFPIPLNEIIANPKIKESPVSYYE